MDDERRDFGQYGRRARALGGTVFFRVLIAALIPFAALFWAAWFLPGRGALLWAGIAAFVLLAVFLYAATRAVVRPILRMAERADDAAGDASAAAWSDVPLAGAAHEAVLLRDALIRMQDALALGNERRFAVLLAELGGTRRTEIADVRNRFVANIVPELLFPLNAIADIAERLLVEKREDERTKFVKSVKTSAESLLSVINETLDLAVMGSGAFFPANADYDFGETLRRVRGQAAALLARKPLVLFEMKADESVPAYLYGDEARMRQMLVNLLGSAARSTNKGFIRFYAWADEKHLHFDISDSGAGVEREEFRKRFDPIRFFSDLEGDGYFSDGVFGLAISKFIVAAMGGSFKAESVPGRGTVYRITVSRVNGDRAAADFRARIASFKAPGARALIVDDSELNQNVAMGILSRYEIRCDKAASGREAIDLLRRNVYDIVFMDRSMPEMDGIQTTGIIRAQGGAFSELPIIAVISDASADVNGLFVSSGFSDFLEKPIDIENLHAILLRRLPEQMIVFADGEEEPPAAYTRTLESAAEVPGLDVALGLRRAEGRQDVYERVLRTVFETTHLMASTLVVELSRRDFDSVRLRADGAKRLLADIGATRLAIMAADLESAAERRNITLCWENAREFIDRLGRFVEALSEAFERAPGDAGEEGGQVKNHSHLSADK